MFKEVPETPPDDDEVLLEPEQSEDHASWYNLKESHKQPALVTMSGKQQVAGERTDSSIFQAAMGSMLSQPNNASSMIGANWQRSSQVTREPAFTNSSIDTSQRDFKQRDATMSSIAYKPETVQDNLTSIIFEEPPSMIQDMSQSSKPADQDDSYNIFSGRLSKDEKANMNMTQSHTLAKSLNPPPYTKANLSMNISAANHRSPSEQKLGGSMMRTSYLSYNDPRHSGAPTQGISEEMIDSVHSLMPPTKGYYDWKKENTRPPEIKLVTEVSAAADWQRKDTSEGNEEFRTSKLIPRDGVVAAELEEEIARNFPEALNQSNGPSVKHSLEDLTIDQIEVRINKRLPEKVPCPQCRQTRLTIVTRERSSLQICYSVLLCLFVLILWPCAYMVWTSDHMMDYHHSCASCHSLISTFNPAKFKKEQKKMKKKNPAGYEPLVSVSVKRKPRGGNTQQQKPLDPSQIKDGVENSL